MLPVKIIEIKGKVFPLKVKCLLHLFPPKLKLQTNMDKLQEPAMQKSNMYRKNCSLPVSYLSENLM